MRPTPERLAEIRSLCDPGGYGDLFTEIDALQAENAAMRAALGALKEGDCWCGFTRVPGQRHTGICKQAQAVLAAPRSDTP